MDEILKALQPRQLGAGTADGVVLTFKLLQECACILEADGHCTVEALDEDAGATEVEGLVAADLTNAYGMFSSSAALRAASDVSPRWRHGWPLNCLAVKPPIGRTWMAHGSMHAPQELLTGT